MFLEYLTLDTLVINVLFNNGSGLRDVTDYCVKILDILYVGNFIIGVIF